LRACPVLKTIHGVLIFPFLVSFPVETGCPALILAEDGFLSIHLAGRFLSIHLPKGGLGSMAQRDSETRLCSGVSPARGGLPDHNPSTARRFRVMAGNETFAISAPLINMLVIGLAILTADLAG